MLQECQRLSALLFMQSGLIRLIYWYVNQPVAMYFESFNLGLDLCM